MLFTPYSLAIVTSTIVVQGQMCTIGMIVQQVLES